MVTFKEIMERDMPEQTIFVGDVVLWCNKYPLGVVIETYNWQGFRLLTIAYKGTPQANIFKRVRQENCRLVGRNYKVRKK